MKMNSALVKKATEQIPAQALPDSHPAVPQLNELFGEHTFFLNQDGLSIVEPLGPTNSGGRKGQVIILAEWQDAQRSGLVPREPAVTDVVVDLGSEPEDEPPKAG